MRIFASVLLGLVGAGLMLAPFVLDGTTIAMLIGFEAGGGAVLALAAYLYLSRRGATAKGNVDIKDYSELEYHTLEK